MIAPREYHVGIISTAAKEISLSCSTAYLPWGQGRILRKGGGGCHNPEENYVIKHGGALDVVLSG